MREKYVEESFPRYFIFGEHRDGMVDIASTKNDTVATVTREHAINLINDREAVVDRLVKIALRFAEVAPEEFSKSWYA